LAPGVVVGGAVRAGFGPLKSAFAHPPAPTSSRHRRVRFCRIAEFCPGQIGFLIFGGYGQTKHRSINALEQLNGPCAIALASLAYFRDDASRIIAGRQRNAATGCRVAFKGDPSDQEIAKMKKQTSVALAAALLLAGVSAASAAGMMKSSGANMAPPARDALTLTSAQQKTAWNDIHMRLLTQNPPAGFKPSVGAVVPHGMTTAPIPEKAASDVPALKPYDFALLKNRLLIVNPTDKKIAEVISG
jgi:hypothetical protein